MARSADRDSRPAPPGADPASERGSTTLELILGTSTELFAERGYAAATMRELADRAHLPLSSFYYYFRRKYDVLLAIMDEAQGRLEVGGEEAFDKSLEPDAQLRALVACHVRFHLENPGAARVADGELRALQAADRAQMVGRRDRYEKRFRDVLAAGAKSGCFAPDLDFSVAAMAILTMSTSVIDWWRPDGPYSVEETAGLLGDFALGIAGCHSWVRSQSTP
ncbi:MAG TPA: TetR/AcrR family transcriptional regulator [Solirubrobacterales bacterium]|jgi:AcrR family transcriptional regulator|nr:TetR/AcrR family transcriptional regulator [Solirubrobacterales bacterium]